MSNLIWNKNKGVEGTIEIIWQGYKLVNVESHYNWVYEEFLKVKQINSLGEEMISEVEVRYFESLIKDDYIISNERGKPLEYIKKLKLQ